MQNLVIGFSSTEMGFNCKLPVQSIRLKVSTIVTLLFLVVFANQADATLPFNFISLSSFIIIRTVDSRISKSRPIS
jgi:hypothetical protein